MYRVEVNERNSDRAVYEHVHISSAFVSMAREALLTEAKLGYQSTVSSSDIEVEMLVNNIVVKRIKFTRE